jgi:GNAT superfamily N-acetyltransferase
MVDLEFHPVTPDRWRDLEKFFGERGACGGCWCMYWRLKRSEFDQKRGAGTKRTLKKLVTSGQAPGILAYVDGEPVGWCSVGPRDDFSTLERSRVLKRVDEEPVWSVVCFFVAKPFRRKGVTVRLLQAAIEYARERGARIVEGYPIEPKKGEVPPIFAYTGLVSAFRKAGFTEVLRRTETRPIMRYFIE